MKKKVTERRLVDVLVSYLRPEHQVGREVTHYEKRIDVVAISTTSEEMWAIEAKTSNWGKAISQAIVNLAAAERSYIAMYALNAHRVPAQVLDEYGIGLIAVGTKWGDVRVVHEAQDSQFLNRIANERIRTLVTQGGK